MRHNRFRRVHFSQGSLRYLTDGSGGSGVQFALRGPVATRAGGDSDPNGALEGSDELNVRLALSAVICTVNLSRRIQIASSTRNWAPPPRAGCCAGRTCG